MLSKRLCCTSDTWLIDGDHQVWACTLSSMNLIIFLTFTPTWQFTERFQQTRPRRTSSEGHRCSFFLRQCWPSPLDCMCLLSHFSNAIFFQLVPMADNPMNTTFDRKVSLTEVSVSICIFASVPLIGQLQGRTNAWPKNLCWYYLWFLPAWYSGPLSKG